VAGVEGRAPRLCHVGTASGDQRWWNARISEAERDSASRYLVSRDERTHAAVEQERDLRQLPRD
jgi:hypothetical protein